MGFTVCDTDRDIMKASFRRCVFCHVVRAQKLHVLREHLDRESVQCGVVYSLQNTVSVLCVYIYIYIYYTHYWVGGIIVYFIGMNIFGSFGL